MEVEGRRFSLKHRTMEVEHRTMEVEGRRFSLKHRTMEIMPDERVNKKSRILVQNSALYIYRCIYAILRFPIYEGNGQAFSNTR
jgi:hypothetical protein